MTHKIREVYIVHHSHTDVGYTDLQEQVIYNQANNIRRAVELIENGIKNNTTQKDLKWNCETWYCVEQFLKVATKEEKKDLFKLSAGVSASAGGGVAAYAESKKVIETDYVNVNAVSIKLKGEFIAGACVQITVPVPYVKWPW